METNTGGPGGAATPRGPAETFREVTRMPAYDTQQREQSTPLLQLKPPRSQRSSKSAHREPGGTGTTRVEVPGIDESFIDALVDQLAGQLAAAVLAHLKDARIDERDEWLDSLEAAEYLGLHRDTLLRLAAARAIPS